MAISIATVAIALGITSVLGAIFPPLGRWTEQNQNRVFPNALPDIFTLADMFMRRGIDDDDYYSSAKRLGFDEQWASQFARGVQQWLNVSDYISSWRRGIISESVLDSKLEALKVPVDDFDTIKQVTEYFPNPADLVRFAVREVYSPLIVDQFGMMEDLPDEFLREAKKAGMQEDQARNFWASHWLLPSIGQGLEMFQRRVIDWPTLNALLRAQDVMPFWRDKITAIAYNPLTRVDVRRMYGMGVLNEQQVFNSYLDVGYSPENAQLMTDFTVLYENDQYTGLTRANIVNAFEDGLITKEQLVEYLKGLRYSESVVQFWVQIASYNRTARVLKEQTEDLKTAFRAGQMSIQDIKEYMYQLDIPATYVEEVVNSLFISQAQRRKIPTKADLDKFLDLGIIDEKEYSSSMMKLGYTDRSVLLYLTYNLETRESDTRTFLSDQKYMEFLKQDIITPETFAAIMTSKGISGDDIARLIDQIEGEKNEPTDGS